MTRRRLLDGARSSMRRSHCPGRHDPARCWCVTGLAADLVGDTLPQLEQISEE